MNTHWLKVWSEYYDDVASGRKPFEVRVDDRTPPYEVGDTLILADWTKTKESMLDGNARKKLHMSYVIPVLYWMAIA